MHFSDNIIETIQKSEIIIDYNKTKEGIDIVNMLSTPYNYGRSRLTAAGQ